MADRLLQELDTINNYIFRLTPEQARELLEKYAISYGLATNSQGCCIVKGPK